MKDVMKEVISIQERLMEVFDKSELSYGEIGKMTGYGKSVVHRYLTGEISKIPVDFVVAFAQATHTDPMWIMGLNESKKKEAPTSESVRSKEIISLFQSVPEDKQEDVIRILKATIEALK